MMDTVVQKFHFTARTIYHLESRLKECSDFKSGDVESALHEVFQGLDTEVVPHRLFKK